MSSSRKKVIVRRFIGDIIPGYLASSGFVRTLTSGRALDLLDLTGRVITLPLDDIKYICYVRDFNLNDTTNPERLTRRTFLARPRSEGLWVRLSFRAPDSDQFEGLAPIDTAILDDMLNDAGLSLTPPNIRSNPHRIYVPRAAITELLLLAVITTPSRRKPIPAAPVPSLQEDLFNTPLPPNAKPN